MLTGLAGLAVPRKAKFGVPDIRKIGLLLINDRKQSASAPAPLRERPPGDPVQVNFLRYREIWMSEFVVFGKSFLKGQTAAAALFSPG